MVEGYTLGGPSIRLCTTYSKYGLHLFVHLLPFFYSPPYRFDSFNSGTSNGY